MQRVAVISMKININANDHFNFVVEKRTHLILFNGIKIHTSTAMRFSTEYMCFIDSKTGSFHKLNYNLIKLKIKNHYFTACTCT